MQIVSCTPNIHLYFHINRQIHYDIKGGKRRFLRFKHTRSLISLFLSPLPFRTGQLDGLLGTMERLYKEVGFEVYYEGSKGG